MTKTPSIGGHSSLAPLADAVTPSSTPVGGGKAAETGAQAGPQGGAVLNGLNALKTGGKSSGGGARASFAAKPSTTERGGTPYVPGGPGSKTSVSGRVSNLLHDASARLGNMGGGRLGGLLQNASAVSSNVGGLAQAGAGLVSAGMSVVGSIMQIEQAEASEIAKIAETGAQNVENAAKG
ncbi:hypothetical protein [Paraburkholderia sp. BCC1885]|uniref:hypothetical protein n=1 Tax=Paraburkholderia sp. BCC1885 TaxID=2562669 RepID=UPI00118276DE|nr:hypothetical protein [Paraburkholderia sp. BCC1885]